MEKGLTFVFLVAGVAMGIAACSSSGDGSTFNGSQQDAGDNQQPISPIVPDQSTGPSTPPSATAVCDPAIPASFKPTWVPPATAKVCSSDDLKGYYAACLDLSKADQKTTCAAWTAAHADCTACLEPKNGSGPFQWYDSAVMPREAFFTNIAGCIAFEQNKLADTDCGAAYNAAVQCNRQSCFKCLDTGGSFQQFQGCEQAVQQQGICKSYESAKATPCQGYKNTGSPAIQCFPGTGETGDVYLPRFAAIFCGQ